MIRWTGPALAASALVIAIGAAGCAHGAPNSSPSSSDPPASPAAAAAPCSASLLFAAAIAGQHFSTDPAEYPPEPGQGPGAYNPVCDGAWAIALISHPNVGTTDGEDLFHAQGGSWTYIGSIGGVPADCLLERAGVPSSIAEVLWPPSQSQPSTYCSA